VAINTKKTSKHDRHVSGLCEKLKPDYDLILRNVPLYVKNRKRQRRIAEIDILAINGGYWDIYEVKCSYRITKARMQLNKIRKILYTTSSVRHTYFYCGASDRIIKI